MSVSGFARFLTAPIVVWFALQGGVAVYTQDIEPVNSGANPYRKILNWGRAPRVAWDRQRRGSTRGSRVAAASWRDITAASVRRGSDPEVDENGKCSRA